MNERDLLEDYAESGNDYIDWGFDEQKPKVAADKFTNENASKLIEKLGAESFEERIAAAKTIADSLKEPAILRALGRGLQNEDLEIRHRCSELIRTHLKDAHGILPGELEGCSGPKHKTTWEDLLSRFDRKQAAELIKTLDLLGVSDRQPLSSDRKIQMFGNQSRPEAQLKSLAEQLLALKTGLTNKEHVKDTVALDRALATIEFNKAVQAPGGALPTELEPLAELARKNPGVLKRDLFIQTAYTALSGESADAREKFISSLPKAARGPLLEAWSNDVAVQRSEAFAQLKEDLEPDARRFPKDSTKLFSSFAINNPRLIFERPFLSLLKTFNGLDKVLPTLPEKQREQLRSRYEKYLCGW